MRVRKVLRILLSASGRTLSCTLGHASPLSSEAEGETTRDLGCGIPRQKVPCLPLSKSARWMVHLWEGTPAGQFSSGQPEAFTRSDSYFQPHKMCLTRTHCMYPASISTKEAFCWFGVRIVRL